MPTILFLTCDDDTLVKAAASPALERPALKSALAQLRKIATA